MIHTRTHPTHIPIHSRTRARAHMHTNKQTNARACVRVWRGEKFKIIVSSTKCLSQEFNETYEGIYVSIILYQQNTETRGDKMPVAPVATASFRRRLVPTFPRFQTRQGLGCHQQCQGSSKKNPKHPVFVGDSDECCI